MKFDTNLSEFNRQFADALLPSFPIGVKALQCADGVLYFRGPVPIPDDPAHTGTHVAVTLDQDVKDALSEATPSERAEMTEILINSLGSQITARYDPKKIGAYCLDIKGRIEILRG